MVRVYKIPQGVSQLEKRRAIAAILGVLVAMPVCVGMVALCFRLDTHSLSVHDVVTAIAMLGIPCAAVLLHSFTLPSLRIELEDERITRTQNRPLGASPLRISFDRREINHIREVRNSGLMVHGRGSKGRYIDLQIPRSVENYDELKARLAAWQPIHESLL
jgi:hypothetical protein